jgi:hypothetical protein
VCKIYFTPVSVESRLLEWRKRATGQATEDDLRATAEAPEARNRRQKQTRFLLGLKDDREGTEEDSDTDLD